MNGQKLFHGVLWGILAALLLVGCSAPADDQLLVNFDGNTCTYKGSSELTIGEYQFIVKNLIGDNLSLVIHRIEEGHTYQELEDRVEEEGHKFPERGTNWPDWMLGYTTRFVTFEKDQATGNELTTWEISREGDHALGIYNTSDVTYWLCAPLKVVAALSE